MYIKFYIEEGFLRGGERVELQLYYFITGYIDTDDPSELRDWIPKLPQIQHQNLMK